MKENSKKSMPPPKFARRGTSVLYRHQYQGLQPLDLPLVHPEPQQQAHRSEERCRTNRAFQYDLPEPPVPARWLAMYRVVSDSILGRQAVAWGSVEQEKHPAGSLFVE